MATTSQAASAAAGDGWPGRRLGLPESGPRSIARPGRRVAGVSIDWAIAYGASYLLFRSADGSTDGLITLIIFVAAQAVLVIVASGGIGHLLLGMRVVPITGGRIGLLRPIARAVLLGLAIPALIWDRDQRGLHDRLSGTVLVRV